MCNNIMWRFYDRDGAMSLCYITYFEVSRQYAMKGMYKIFVCFMWARRTGLFRSLHGADVITADARVYNYMANGVIILIIYSRLLYETSARSQWRHYAHFQ